MHRADSMGTTVMFRTQAQLVFDHLFLYRVIPHWSGFPQKELL